MRLFGQRKPSASEVVDDGLCIKCGAQPRLICKMLEPSTGKTLRMFDCRCGDRTWRDQSACIA